MTKYTPLPLVALLVAVLVMQHLTLVAMDQQTALLRTIAEQTRAPIAVKVDLLGSEAAHALDDALKPKGRK